MSTLVGGLSFRPCFIALCALFPISVCAREALASNHSGTRNEEEGLVWDRSSRPDGFPLGILEHIDILGYSLDLEVVALHLVMQRQEFKGVPAGSPRLEL